MEELKTSNVLKLEMKKTQKPSRWLRVHKELSCWGDLGKCNQISGSQNYIAFLKDSRNPEQREE